MLFRSGESTKQMIRKRHKKKQYMNLTHKGKTITGTRTRHMPLEETKLKHILRTNYTSLPDLPSLNRARYIMLEHTLNGTFAAPSQSRKIKKELRGLPCCVDAFPVISTNAVHLKPLEMETKKRIIRNLLLEPKNIYMGRLAHCYPDRANVIIRSL